MAVGGQCWFAENLRSENYQNGEAIPANLTDSEWENTMSGAVAVYGESLACEDFLSDIDACDLFQSLNEFDASTTGTRWTTPEAFARPVGTFPQMGSGQ